MKQSQSPQGVHILLYILIGAAIIFIFFLLFSFTTKPERAVVTKVAPHQAWARWYRYKYTAVFECQPSFKVGDTVNVEQWKRY